MYQTLSELASFCQRCDKNILVCIFPFTVYIGLHSHCLAIEKNTFQLTRRYRSSVSERSCSLAAAVTAADAGGGVDGAAVCRHITFVHSRRPVRHRGMLGCRC